MGATKIEWADAVWNPITGCTWISEGCDHCYAKRMANRLKGRYGYPADNPFRVTFHPERLEDPLRWKTPRRVFVCSMGDFFHGMVMLEWKERVFRIIDSCPEHTFMFLTKRPENVASWWYTGPRNNVWLGVTAENQRRLDERVVELLRIPAAVRFVSVEPMLGPVRIGDSVIIAQRGDKPDGNSRGIDWVIAGGETGPGARPMHPDWVRSLRDQCANARVPFFFKQWGFWKGSADFNGTSMIPASERRGRLLDGREWNEFPA